ncbi:hypothetical protein DI041_03890 [Stenotrophomonas maltophilia]|uniref:zinc ribbon domain-containing protein n=1 Tax=Stenotrophomonas maltophilia TaxID=40324 RepID=UPI0010AADD11|nr:zinc ribbon domain-containing protein [Stenotrophomonas maltophilia]TIE21022.1 hypothetical protein DI034_02245 [Stenotrophomonas maltophilia]TIE64468.1 hypothetical protein DI041_03890 [Stenotrophomonas maltophilia]
MALIACVECGRQVSDQAEACPNCGHPIRAKATPPVVPAYQPKPASKTNTGCALIILLVVILAVVATCMPTRDSGNSGGTSPGAQDMPAESAEQKQARLLAEVNDEQRTDEARLAAAKQLVAFNGSSEAGKHAAALAAALEEKIRKANLGRQWRYWSDNDSMTGKMSIGADVQSSNTHTFDFPYAGAQHATLSLRRHPQHGNDVFMRIERGQLQCSSYSGCDVLVRFGDGEPKRYHALGPADNSSETIFIQGYSDFARRMKDVDVVRIQANVFRQGSPAWEFDVSGFDPNRLKNP